MTPAVLAPQHGLRRLGSVADLPADEDEVDAAGHKPGRPRLPETLVCADRPQHQCVGIGGARIRGGSVSGHHQISVKCMRRCLRRVVAWFTTGIRR
jgi:hypothetical protein